MRSSKAISIVGLSVALFGGLALLASGSIAPARAAGAGIDVQVEQAGTQISYVVFHAVDRDGFCDAAAFGAISLHPVLTDAPNDTMPDGPLALPNPRATLDVYIDSGDGVIINTSDGPAPGSRTITGLRTFSTYDNANAGSPIQAFPPLHSGAVDECQAWVEVVSSLGRPANVLMIFHDDTGDVGFDRVVNGAAAATPSAPPAGGSPQSSTTVTLAPGWSLMTWSGRDGAAPGDVVPGAQVGSGGAISAVYAWDAASGRWLGYFPGADAAPGANTLAALRTGQAYWVAVSGSEPVQWQVGAQ